MSRSVLLQRHERKSVDLSLASEVDRAFKLEKVAPAERLAFLMRAQQGAERSGDLELLAAIAQWRLRHQVEPESLKASSIS